MLAGASPHGFPPANATETRSGRIGIAAVAAAVAMDATLALAVGDGAGALAAATSAMMATIGLAAKTAIDVSTFAITFRANTIARLVAFVVAMAVDSVESAWSTSTALASGGVCRAGMGSAGGEGGGRCHRRHAHDGGRCVLVGRGDRGGNCRDSFCRGRQVRAARASVWRRRRDEVPAEREAPSRHYWYYWE